MQKIEDQHVIQLDSAFGTGIGFGNSSYCCIIVSRFCPKLVMWIENLLVWVEIGYLIHLVSLPLMACFPWLRIQFMRLLRSVPLVAIHRLVKKRVVLYWRQYKRIVYFYMEFAGQMIHHLLWIETILQRSSNCDSRVTLRSTAQPKCWIGLFNDAGRKAKTILEKTRVPSLWPRPLLALSLPLW